MLKKWALVTGACVNTGAAIVEKFASEGENVVFTGRNAERVRAAEEGFAAKFPNVEIIGKTLNALKKDGNVDEENVKKLFSELDEEGIVITDLVLNAADLGVGFNVLESSLSDFRKVTDTNVCWNFCIIQNAVKRMVIAENIAGGTVGDFAGGTVGDIAGGTEGDFAGGANGASNAGAATAKQNAKNVGGSITFINSNTAYRAIPERAAYSASKGGQLGLMRALALDLGKYGIRVNAVLPGMIHTDRTDKNPEFYKNVPSAFSPLGTIAEGADIAEAVWYFAAHANNVTGAELTVDCGNMIQLYPIIP